MSEPFLSEIRMFAGNFAPRGWAFCDGQLMSIAQNTALFSLVGTTYGGDGRTSFGIPDLRGRAPMHPGRGPGLTERRLGQRGGIATVTLSQAELPNHNHTMRCVREEAEEASPEGNSWAATVSPLQQKAYAAPAEGSTVPMATSTLGDGTSTPHPNMQPYLGLSFIIALTGLFPSRS